jgi:hypothetical protein
MSADDTYIVSRLHGEDELYGVFHTMGDGDEPSQYYVEENSIETHDDPVRAIVRGHKLNSKKWAEYGVYVNTLVIADAERRLGL